MQTPALTRRNRRILVGIYGAALLYFILKQCYYSFVVEGFPDQMVHLSYIIEMAKRPTVLPDFANIPIYQVHGHEGNLTLFVPIPGTISALFHPPLYYLIMALLGGVRFMPDGAAALNTMYIRVLNIGLTDIAILLAFYLGWTRLSKRSPLVHALYAGAVVTLPMVAYIGASVNNDNLAFLSVIIFILGLARYNEDKLDFKTYLLIGGGFFLGSFSKLTTALMMIIMLGVALVMSVIRTRSLKLVANKWFLITLPCYLLFAAYMFWMKKTYGAFQPSLLDINEEAFRQTIYYVRPENRVPMTFLQYVRHFVGGVGYSWSSLYGHNHQVTQMMNNGVTGFVYWIPVGLSVFAAVRQCVRKNVDRFTLPVVLGFLGTVAYPFYSNWKGYPVSGYLGAIQARYYLAMIVPLAYIMCDQVAPLFGKRKTLGCVLAILLLIAWLMGDAPRLVLQYGFPVS